MGITLAKIDLHESYPPISIFRIYDCTNNHSLYFGFFENPYKVVKSFFTTFIITTNTLINHFRICVK